MDPSLQGERSLCCTIASLVVEIISYPATFSASLYVRTVDILDLLDFNLTPMIVCITYTSDSRSYIELAGVETSFNPLKAFFDRLTNYPLMDFC